MRQEKYVRTLGIVARELKRRGIEFVLVGSAVLPVVYRLDYDPHDIDLFILNKSTILDSELFDEIARENDWDVGTSEHGTLYYELVVGGDIVRVDLLENVLDVYIPEELVRSAREVDADGVKVMAIGLEELLVLKAKVATREAEEFINSVARMALERNIKLDYSKMRRYSELFPDDAEGILRRLRRNGIYID
ncbi:MAG: nucleotidyltransferase [Thermoproteaceae archaeon]|nr:nucleotidyltransferase [Thermoproteaceae archaeon]